VRPIFFFVAFPLLTQRHWIVLDELNLASNEVLEALNRLLDDSHRELLVADTQVLPKALSLHHIDIDSPCWNAGACAATSALHAIRNTEPPRPVWGPQGALSYLPAALCRDPVRRDAPGRAAGRAVRVRVPLEVRKEVRKRQGIAQLLLRCWSESQYLSRKEREMGKWLSRTSCSLPFASY